MDKPRYIRSASYYLHYNSVRINDYELESEDKNYYHGVDKNGNSYSFRKDNIGKPILKNETSAANVFMIDADNSTLIESLSKWFTDKAQEILKMKESGHL